MNVADPERSPLRPTRTIPATVPATTMPATTMPGSRVAIRSASRVGDPERPDNEEEQVSIAFTPDPASTSAAAAGCRVRAMVDIPLDGSEPTGSFFSFEGLPDDREHVAIGLGPWRTVDVPLIRIHSECLTGDVFHSLRCDCGDQLAEGVRRIGAHGGFLLYLRQEGRGIGLYNKLDAYLLQDAGMNTFEANRALGFADDARTYAVAAEMIRALGHRRVRLLSNNPHKERQLRDHAIDVVERLRTGVHVNVHNDGYLKSKAALGGHDIDCGVKKASVAP